MRIVENTEVSDRDLELMLDTTVRALGVDPSKT